MGVLLHCTISGCEEAQILNILKRQIKQTEKSSNTVYTKKLVSFSSKGVDCLPTSLLGINVSMHTHVSACPFSL